MWIIIGSVATVIALFFISLAIYNEYKWAKQGGRQMFRDKLDNWHK